MAVPNVRLLRMKEGKTFIDIARIAVAEWKVRDDMSRMENNKKMIDHFKKQQEEYPEGSFEKMVVWNLALIGSCLADISKSLAVIADKAESEG